MKRVLLLFFITIFAPILVFSSRPKIALVLSGGGARGISQIPIIKELESRGIYPDYVCGTSIGALIGALYSAGYSGEEIEKIVKEENLTDIVFNIRSEEKPIERPYSDYDRTQLTLSITNSGIGLNNSILDDSNIEGLIRRKLAKVIDVKSFDELSIPFRCVGTDFTTGEAIVFSEDLYTALRSSMSLPLVFAPQQLADGRYVVDGGMANNLPSSIARALGADIVIAIDVNDSVRANATEPKYLETLSGVATQFVILVSMGNVRNEHEVSDYVLIPDTSNIGVIDFYSVDEILVIGNNCVKENKTVFDSLEEDLKEYLPLNKPKSYSELPYIQVKEVVFPNELIKYEKLFSYFNNREYDESYVSSLSSLLKQLKERENLKSISYKIVDNKLIISTSKYDDRVVNLSIGLSSDLSFRTNFKDGYIFLSPSVTLGATYFTEYGKISGSMKIGSINLLSFEYSYPLVDHLDIAFLLEGGFGSYSVSSITSLKNHEVSQDGRLSFTTLFTNHISNNKRLDFSIFADYTSFDVFSNKSFLYRLGGGFTYTSKSNYYQLNVKLFAGYNNNLFYDAKYDLSIYLNKVNIALSLSAIRDDIRLASSYNIDLFSDLSKDRIMGEVSYNLYENKYLKLSLGGFINFTDLNNNSIFPFTMLNDISFGPIINLSLYSADVFDINLNLAISSKNKLSIGLYIR